MFYVHYYKQTGDKVLLLLISLNIKIAASGKVSITIGRGLYGVRTGAALRR